VNLAGIISERAVAAGMGIESDCPDCGGTEFYRAADTEIHLGEKVKYRCSECDHGVVRIDGAVDTSTA
jgi:predicted RNA-binding Zn-ribbon protein involved in translation (DUF1610 family)